MLVGLRPFQNKTALEIIQLRLELSRRQSNSQHSIHSLGEDFWKTLVWSTSMQITQHRVRRAGLLS